MYRSSKLSFSSYELYLYIHLLAQYTHNTYILAHIYSLIYVLHPHIHYLQKIFGGDKEIRTLDPLLARQVLSQLSYTPKIAFNALKASMGFEN